MTTSTLEKLQFNPKENSQERRKFTVDAGSTFQNFPLQHQVAPLKQSVTQGSSQKSPQGPLLILGMISAIHHPILMESSEVTAEPGLCKLLRAPCRHRSLSFLSAHPLGRVALVSSLLTPPWSWLIHREEEQLTHHDVCGLASGVQVCLNGLLEHLSGFQASSPWPLQGLLSQEEVQQNTSACAHLPGKSSLWRSVLQKNTSLDVMEMPPPKPYLSGTS